MIARVLARAMTIAATDADIVASIAEVLRASHAAAVPGAWRIIVERLRPALRRQARRPCGAAIRAGASSGKQVASAPSAARTGGVDQEDRALSDGS
jgi:hypothetical protein